MKKLLLIGVLFCALCSCGSGNSKKKAPANVHEGHEWVDLGLPSGLRWATCNVGASSPKEYGDYFAWGETYTKSKYLLSNSAFSDISRSDICGYSSCDAAYANWGGNWTLPTKEDFQELIDNCIFTWIKLNGCNGCKVTGPSGKSIFFPAAGVRGDESGRYDYGDVDYGGSIGFYWSSTPARWERSACSLYLDGYYLEEGDFQHLTSETSRHLGCSVRPVLRD